MASFDDPNFTGDRWAAWDSGALDWGPDPAPAVTFLADLAGQGGRALELAIGGGRVAKPLAHCGVTVEGIEASQAVADRLHSTTEGKAIPVVVADMADVPATGPFDLVYVVWNSLFNLTSQDRQVQCFRNVAAVLRPGGSFVIECYVPDHTEFDRPVTTDGLTEDSASITVNQHDRLQQRIVQQHLTFTEQGVRMLPVAQRYSWPGELDLMAQLAGMHLADRYGDWSRTPFGPESINHVSVYRAG